MGLVQPRDEPGPRGGQRAVDADAEESVNDQRRAPGKQLFQLGQVRRRVCDLQHLVLTVFQGLPGVARVIPIVAFAGKDEHPGAGLSQSQSVLADASAHAANDVSLRLTGGPGSFFPFPHLCNADDRTWHKAKLLHRFEDSTRNRSLGKTGGIARSGWLQEAQIRAETLLALFGSDGFPGCNAPLTCESGKEEFERAALKRRGR